MSYENLPYTSQPSYGALPDPFATPATSTYAPSVPHDAYGTPLHPLTPPPGMDYHNQPYQQPGTPGPSSYGHSYELRDDPDPDNGDTGDIPLLTREPSQGSTFRAVPGAYDEEDKVESNIRYGRIPQRVPRRYKTIKKVEYVSFSQVPLRTIESC